MKFKATDEQVKQIFCNAINASIPVGMGFLHFKPEDVKPEEIEMYTIGEDLRFDADYFQGRMVKLSISQTDNEGEWKITKPIDEPTQDYQSWATKYPTKEALVNSVLG